MQLQELATAIGAPTDVATQLLETYGIKLDTITPKEVESLKSAANPGQLAAKPQKKAAKQIGGDTGYALTQGTTATLTAPEAPTIETNTVLPTMDLEAVRDHFEALTLGATLPIEQAAQDGIMRGVAKKQQAVSGTDNLFCTVATDHYRARYPH